MEKQNRVRLGAVALGVSGLLFASFPLLMRPFFHYSEVSSPDTFAAASREMTSAAWLVSHLLGMLAFVLLLFGLLTLFAFLTAHARGLYPFGGMILSILGIALLLPMLGVETFTLPVIGKVYLEGQTGVAPMLDLVRRGPGFVLLLFGLLLLAGGAIFFAVAIWRSDLLPKWAGVTFALGLALWYPILPQIMRLVDGVLIGIGGFWLAWALWQNA